ncbi:MAG: thiamine phosphate synthase [Pyrinomonadaceae bacterium]
MWDLGLGTFSILDSFPKLYAITDARLAAPLTHSEQVVCLCEGGARLIQVREKNLAPREFYTAAERALHVAHKHGARLIINDRVDIALALKTDGVHLGQDDLPPEAARRLLGENFNIGFSTHTVAEATAAARMPIDYLAIGPVFDTTTKENPDAVIGLEGVRRVRDELDKISCPLPLVAIGGITHANARQVLKAGAHSVAVIGALLTNSEREIVARTRQLIQLIEDVS